MILTLILIAFAIWAVIVVARTINEIWRKQDNEYERDYKNEPE